MHTNATIEVEWANGHNLFSEKLGEHGGTGSWPRSRTTTIYFAVLCWSIYFAVLCRSESGKRRFFLL